MNKFTSEELQKARGKIYIRLNENNEYIPCLHESLFIPKNEMINTRRNIGLCESAHDILKEHRNYTTYSLKGLVDEIKNKIDFIASDNYTLFYKNANMYTGWKAYDAENYNHCLISKENKNSDSVGIPIYVSFFVDKNDYIIASIDHESLFNKDDRAIVILLNMYWKMVEIGELPKNETYINNVDNRMLLGKAVEHEISHAMALLSGRSHPTDTIDRQKIEFNISNETRKLLEDMLYDLSPDEQHAHIQGLIGALNQIHSKENNTQRIAEEALYYAHRKGRNNMTIRDVIMAYFCCDTIRHAVHIDPFYEMMNDIVKDVYNDINVFIIGYYLNKYKMIDYMSLKKKKYGDGFNKDTYDRFITTGMGISEMISLNKPIVEENEHKHLSVTIRYTIFENFQNFLEDVYMTIVEYLFDNEIIVHQNKEEIIKKLEEEGIDYENAEDRMIFRTSNHVQFESLMNIISPLITEKFIPQQNKFVID